MKTGENILKNMKKRSFKKDLKNMNEIKSTKIPINIKIHILSSLNNLDIKVYAIVIKKKDLKIRNLLGTKSVNKTYIKIISKLVDFITIKRQISLKMDKFLPNNYENILYQELKNKNNHFMQKSKIYCVCSQKSKGIQIADLITWCIFQKYKNKNHSFIDMIKLKCKIVEC